MWALFGVSKKKWKGCNTQMQKQMKKMMSLVLALAMILCLAACGGTNGQNSGSGTTNNDAAVSQNDGTDANTASDSADTQEEAETPALSGTMKVVATSEDYVTLFDKFTEETGVKVELLSMSSGDVLSKLRAEGGTPSADLWFGGGIDAFMSAKYDGLVEHVNFAAADELADEFKDSEGYWYSKGITIVGFLLNNTLMEELNLTAPATWDDLLDSSYQGEIIMSNPAVSGTNYAVVNALLQNKENGWDYFTALNENIAYYAKRGSDPLNKVIADEFAIGITYIDGTVEALLDEYDVTIVYPEDGLPWVPEGVAVFKNAENVDAAKYFVEWLFSSDENLQMLAEIDQKTGAKIIKPSLEGVEVNYDTSILMEEDLSLFGSQREDILSQFETLMGDKAADE